MNRKQYRITIIIIAFMLGLFIFILMLEYATILINPQTNHDDEQLEFVDVPGTVMTLALLGDEGAASDTVRNYLDDISIEYTLVSSFDEIEQLPTAVVVCNDALLEQDEWDGMLELQEQGADIILSSLPEFDIMKQGDNADAIGILNLIEDTKNTQGIRFINSFMLGGLSDYTSIEHSMAEVELKAGTKTYSYRITDMDMELGTTNETLPPTIWSYRDGAGAIYVINTDLFTTNSNIGTGIFCSLLSEVQPNFTYPTVNAFMLAYTNLPSSGFDDEIMMDTYYRNGYDTQADIFLPTIESIARKYETVLTFVADDDYDTEIPDDISDKFQNIVIRLNGEMIPEPNYEEGTVFDVFSNNSDKIYYDETEIVTYKTLLTSYGLISREVNMENILQPENGDFNWQPASEALESNIALMRQTHPELDSLTYSELENRTEAYMDYKPTVEYADNYVTIRREHTDDITYMIITTSMDISGVYGGQAKELEEDAWQIELYSDIVQIQLTQPPDTLYNYGKS